MNVTHGGTYQDAVQPLRFLYPNDESKRRVKVTLMKYYNIGRHYFVDIDEEDNPMLRNDGQWFLPWDYTGWTFPNDEPAPWKGYHETEIFDDPSSARSFIIDKVGTFSSETHVIDVQDYLEDWDGDKKWWYKDGD